MNKKITMQDLQKIRDAISQEYVLDFFRTELHSDGVRFDIARSIGDLVNITCHYRHELDYREHLTFVVRFNEHNRCEVSLNLEGLYTGNEMYTLLHLSRILDNTIDIALQKS